MLTLPAPAKLNLFLHIIGRRADGYHELQSVMQFVDFHDLLTFQLPKNHHLTLTSSDGNIPIRDNLVYKAALLLQKKYHVTAGATITLTKNLPVGAGLGGGSSDAATTLIGLNRLWNLNLSTNVLASLGLQLGADVPFFVRGFAAWAEGVGERLTPIDLPEPWYLLAIPAASISTAQLFANTQLTRNCPVITMDDYLFGSGENVFADPVYGQYPAVKKAADWLSGFSRARLTGTGCVVFAVFDTEHEAGTIADLAPAGLRCVVTKGLNVSPLLALMQ